MQRILRPRRAVPSTQLMKRTSLSVCHLVLIFKDLNTYPLFSVQREAVATAARKRDSPSTGAKNSTLRKTQKENQADAIYNGRPINLTAPPIEIYHPTFAKFRHEISVKIDKSSFTPNELSMAFDLVINSLAFYEDEDARIRDITTAMNALVDDQVLRRTEIMRDCGKLYKPDGSIFVQCEKFPSRDEAATAFDEIKNAIGEGGSDPIHQAQCDYVLFYSAKDVRCSFSYLCRS